MIAHGLPIYVALEPVDMRLRAEAAIDLVRMAEMDQSVRTLPEPVVGLELIPSAELARFLDRFGWPTAQGWAREVVDAAFLLAQHSPDVALQERVLAAIASEIEHDSNAAWLAARGSRYRSRIVMASTSADALQVSAARVVHPGDELALRQRSSSAASTLMTTPTPRRDAAQR